MVINAIFRNGEIRKSFLIDLNIFELFYVYARHECMSVSWQQLWQSEASFELLLSVSSSGGAAGSTWVFSPGHQAFDLLGHPARQLEQQVCDTDSPKISLFLSPKRLLKNFIVLFI